MPSRIQQKHTRGWRAPLDPHGQKPISVGRGTPFGNPWSVAHNSARTEWAVKWAGAEPEPPHGLKPVIPADDRHAAHALAADLYEKWLDTQPKLLDRVRRELAGRALMDWCDMDLPCHVDVLLRRANPDTTTAPHDDDDDEIPPTPEQLLARLGQQYTRAVAEPLPAHPDVLLWQMQAATLAAGLARALHALNDKDPTTAAQIAALYHGPLGDGPDPEEHADWLRRVAGNTTVRQWQNHAQHAAAAYRATERNPAELESILTSMANPAPCKPNSDGECRTHGYATYSRCPHGRAQALYTKEDTRG